MGRLPGVGKDGKGCEKGKKLANLKGRKSDMFFLLKDLTLLDLHLLFTLEE